MTCLNIILLALLALSNYLWFIFFHSYRTTIKKFIGDTYDD